LAEVLAPELVELVEADEEPFEEAASPEPEEEDDEEESDDVDELEEPPRLSVR